MKHTYSVREVFEILADIIKTNGFEKTKTTILSMLNMLETIENEKEN